MSLDNYGLDFKRKEAFEPLQKARKTRVTIDIEELNEDDLLSLRDKIDDKLGGVGLNDVNIANEMVLQMKKARLLQDEVSEDEGVPANQRAQVQNSLASIISTLAKLQNVTYTSERLKRIEAVLIRTMKKQPADVQDAFFLAYDAEADNELI